MVCYKLLDSVANSSEQFLVSEIRYMRGHSSLASPEFATLYDSANTFSHERFKRATCTPPCHAKVMYSVGGGKGRHLGVVLLKSPDFAFMR